MLTSQRKQQIKEILDTDGATSHVTHPTVFEGFLQVTLAKYIKTDNEVRNAWHFYFCGWLDAEIRTLKTGDVT